MNTRESTHLTLLATVALVVKIALFRDVALNGDTGLFLYDAKLIRLGKQMFVDFPSRSPVFEYLLTIPVAAPGSTIVNARLTMIALTVLVGLAVYAYTRRVHSHPAGIAAAAFVWFVPYPLIWGMWVKTEVVLGGIVLVAFALADGIPDRDIGLVLPVSIGAVFAIATLVRRSALVVIAAFAAWWLYYRFIHVTHADPAEAVLGFVETVKAGVVMAVVWAGLLAAAYWFIAQGDPTTTATIADQHIIRLFTSEGAGVISWTAIDEPKAITAWESGSILGLLCQKCGANTVSVFSRTIMLVLPLLVVLLVFLRSYLREGNRFVADTAFPVAFLVIAAVRVGVLFRTDYVERIVAVAVFVGAIVYVWWLSEPVEWDDLWRPEFGVVTSALMLLAVTYLWRDRILYVTYFQDFYPLMAVLGGVTVVEFWRAQGWPTKWERLSFDFDMMLHGSIVWLRGARDGFDERSLELGSDAARYSGKISLGIVIISGAVFVSGANAYPHVPDGPRTGTNWFTVDLVQEYAEDIEERTDPGDRVYTAQPLYVVDADRRAVADLSRKYYSFQGWPNHTATKRVERELEQSFRSGDASIAITGHTSAWTLDTSQSVRDALRENYCRVEDDSLYNRTGSRLYEYAPNRTGCERYVHRGPRPVGVPNGSD